ncbi:Uncharacterised protein [Vibrio cholerae]|nr:Uncharacterised protein [Vibrio cholerae]
MALTVPCDWLRSSIVKPILGSNSGKRCHSTS